MYFFSWLSQIKPQICYFTTCSKSGNYKVHVLFFFQLFSRINWKIRLMCDISFFSCFPSGNLLFNSLHLFPFPASLLQLIESWTPWRALKFFQLSIHTCALCQPLEKKVKYRSFKGSSIILLENNKRFDTEPHNKSFFYQKWCQTRSRTFSMEYFTGVSESFAIQQWLC